jgi:hypothetical protein
MRGGSMKRSIVLIMLIQLMVLSLNSTRIDRWANLRYLIGTWKIVKPEVTNTQKYSFIFNGTFIKMETRSVFKPTEKKPEGEVHEDVGIFSYDGHKNRLMLRSFHLEGFVNTYVLDKISDDGKTLVFITEAVENAPAGTKAKLTFNKINKNQFTQKFFVAWPNKDYNCYADNHFKRVN